MSKNYIVINRLVEQGKLSEASAEQAISLSRQSGMPSLFHLIHDCAANPGDVANILRAQEDGVTICPKCDGEGSMPAGKGDGSCFLCKQKGVVPVEAAFDWLDNNRCIPGF